MPRFLKQIIIASIFLVAVVLVIYSSFLKDVGEPPAEPASIQSPIVVSQKLLKVGDFDPERNREGSQRASVSYGVDYDFLAEVKNPNLDFGAAAASYELNLFGRDDEFIETRRGSISLLPGQTRYEIISPLKTDREISKVVFKITNADWQKLREYIPQTLFSVKNREYEQGLSPHLKGTLSNNSNFDFDRVDVYVVLFDENGDVLTVNKTDIRTFLAGTDRFFEVRWTAPFKKPVGRVDINAYTDVFKNDNFIKEHGTQEKFQKLY